MRGFCSVSASASDRTLCSGTLTRWTSVKRRRTASACRSRRTTPTPCSRSREGLRRGCDTFYLYGTTGGARLDHTLANLQSLAFLLRHGARGYLYDRDFVYTVIENETLALEREVDWGIVSLFSMGDRAEHITLEGLQYPLTDGTIDCGFPLGVSNHIVAPTARITVGRGPLLVGWELPKSAGEE